MEIKPVKETILEPGIPNIEEALDAVMYGKAKFNRGWKNQ